MEVDKSKLWEEAVVGHWFDWSTEVVQVRERGSREGGEGQYVSLQSAGECGS